jgi:hypothetical protein
MKTTEGRRVMDDHFARTGEDHEASTFVKREGVRRKATFVLTAPALTRSRPYRIRPSSFVSRPSSLVLQP